MSNSFIINHLRAGGSKGQEQQQQLPAVSSHGSSISSFIRRRHSLGHPSPAAAMATLSPDFAYLPTTRRDHFGLSAPILPSHEQAAAAAVATNSAFLWSDKIFLMKLRTMLQSVEITGENDIVSWGPRGLAFIILDKHRFMTIVAPKYLNVFSHATFRMVAESWGFMIDQDEHHEIFHHPYFLRDDPSKCSNLTMEDMKRLSLDGDASGGAKLEDAMLLLPTGTTTTKAGSNNRSLRDKSKSPFSEKQIKRLPKKSSNVKKGIKNSVIKGYLDGTLRFNGGNPTMVDGMAQPQPGPSSRVAMLKTRRRHSIHSTMPVSVLPPQEMVSLAQYHAAPSPAANSTAQAEGNYQNKIPKVANKFDKKKAKSGISSDLSFLMYKGAVISNKDRNLLDDMRDILTCAEQEGLEHIVSWIAQGRAFIVHNEKDFQTYILPRFSNKTSFASFQTALDRWGFHRFEDLSKWPARSGVYYHPLFSRDLPHYCLNKTSMQMKATSYREGDPLPLAMTTLGFPNNGRKIG